MCPERLGEACWIFTVDRTVCGDSPLLHWQAEHTHSQTLLCSKELRFHLSGCFCFCSHVSACHLFSQWDMSKGWRQTGLVILTVGRQSLQTA